MVSGKSLILPRINFQTLSKKLFAALTVSLIRKRERWKSIYPEIEKIEFTEKSLFGFSYDCRRPATQLQRVSFNSQTFNWVNQ